MKKIMRLDLVAAIALTGLVGATQTAQATIYWYGVDFTNSADGGCPYGPDFGGTFANTYQAVGTETYNCGDVANQVDLVSSAPDTGYANVEIQSAVETGYCLTQSYWGGPLSGSYQTQWQPCFGGDTQLWAMTTAKSPNGYMHYINFYNFAFHTCLDGGFNQAYGFPKNGCNAAQSPFGSYNPWQVWNLYYP